MSVSKKTANQQFDLSIQELLEAYQSIHDYCMQNPREINCAVAIPAYLYPAIHKLQLFKNIDSVSCTFVYGRLTGEPYTNSLYIKSNGDAYLSASMINDDCWRVGNILDTELEQIWLRDSEDVRKQLYALRDSFSRDIICGQCCAKRYCFMTDISYLRPFVTESSCSIMSDINGWRAIGG
jgi:MoaA/NifB/PqqE/SkfB family radical SAM enzyme